MAETPPVQAGQQPPPPLPPQLVRAGGHQWSWPTGAVAVVGCLGALASFVYLLTTTIIPAAKGAEHAVGKHTWEALGGLSGGLALIAAGGLARPIVDWEALIAESRTTVDEVYPEIKNATIEAVDLWRENARIESDLHLVGEMAAIRTYVRVCAAVKQMETVAPGLSEDQLAARAQLFQIKQNLTTIAHQRLDQLSPDSEEYNAWSTALQMYASEM
jgi:hypothetical protein